MKINEPQPKPPWSAAPPWANVLFRNGYGAWTWADKWHPPFQVQEATPRIFDNYTLTFYDSERTVEYRPTEDRPCLES